MYLSTPRLGRSEGSENLEKMRAVLSVVLLLLASGASAIADSPAQAPRHAPVVPAGLVPSAIRKAEHAYVATLFMGTPPEEMTMEVRFDVSGLWIYREQSTHSATYELEFDGRTETDLVYCGGVRHRMRVHTHAQPVIDTSVDGSVALLCADCSGVLGLRSDSELWQWWGEASFTPASITLGGRAPPLKDRHDMWSLPCVNPDTDPSLCTVRVAWEGEIYYASFALHSPYTIAPRAMVRRYLADKNVYDSSKAWDPLVLEFVDSVGSRGPLTISLDHSELSGQHGGEARELLIKSGVSNTTITLGSAVLWHVLLHRTASHEALVVHLHPVFAHLPIAHSILFLLGFLFLARWKLTDLARHYARPPRRLDVRIVDAVYQVAGWVLAITSTALPETQAIMSETPVLYGTAIAIIAGGIVIEAGVRMTLMAYVRKMRRRKAAVDQTRPRPNAYLFMLLESVWHEAVLITALWLLVVARRREGIAGPLTVVVSLVGLYSVTVDFIYVAVFMGARFFTASSSADGVGDRKPPPSYPVVRRSTIVLAVAALVSVLFLFGVYLVLFVGFFGVPLVNRTAAIYEQLSVVVVVALAVFTVLIAAWVAGSYLHHGCAVLAKQRRDALQEETERGQREDAGR